MKILAVDDNKDITEMLNTVFTTLGYDFTYVNDGKSGLSKIRNEKFDLVLLDVSMPEFSGIDVLNALVNEGLVNKQKVVLFTASSFTDSEMDELIKKGVYYCIRKPVDIDVLLQLVEHMCKC